MEIKHIRRNLSVVSILVSVVAIGEDFSILVKGGKGHIGGCVLSIPHPSMSDEKRISCTTSIMNVTGHRDGVILKTLSEALCRASGMTVSCTGGIHVDHATTEQIQEIQSAVEEIAEEIAKSVNILHR